MFARLTQETRFGLLFALVFALVALAPLRHGEELRYWALGVAVVILALAVWRPRYLAWPLKGWTALGMALHHVVSPVVMGLLFFGVFTPAGVLLRLFGKRLLPMRGDPAATSYWIEREQPAPAKDSMKFGF